MKIIKIKGCDDCPNSEYYMSVNHWWCNIKGKQIDFKVALHPNKVPSWCPLEDYKEDKK